MLWLELVADLPAQNWWKNVCLTMALTTVLPSTFLDHFSSVSACSTSGLICGQNDIRRCR